MYMPRSLVSFIETEHPPFRDLLASHKRHIAYMLWLWAYGRFRHSVYPSSAAFSKEVLEDIWGNLDTQRAVCKGYFAVIQGDKFNKYASAYQPMDFLGRALIQCLKSKSPDELIEPSGRLLALPRNVIRTRAANRDPNVTHAKHSVWAGLKCSPVVPINQKALEEFIRKTDDPLHQLAAQQLLKASRNTLCPGCIPVQYEQKSTGRLVEVLSLIQSTPREVLSAALDGYWDYDLSNAHFSILKAWANSLGHEAPVIDRYLNEKKQIRTELAEQCAADPDDIKSCLISLMYGAALSSHEKYASIGRVLSKPVAKRFNTSPFVVALNKEIKKLRKYVVPTMKQHAGRYVNAMNISVPPNGKKNEKAVLLSHALQGYEALALKSIMSHHGIKIVLPMHDGWVATEPLDIIQLQELIKESTGFVVEVEEQRLPKYRPKQTTAPSLPASDPKQTLLMAYEAKYEGLFAKPDDPAKDRGMILSAAPKWSRPDYFHGRAGRSNKP